MTVRKFEFSLQNVLDLRTREEDLARQRLAEAHRAADGISRQLAYAQGHHDRVAEMLRDEAGCQTEDQGVPLGMLAGGQMCLTLLRAEIARLRQRLQRADDLCDERRVQLIGASQRRKTLERLAEKRETEHRRSELLGEQRQLDEMGAIGFAGARALTGERHPAGRSTA
ncbi:MAG TPA: flagellar export protein FliJ [Armatimonadota bacterium]|nr:flagellar export protein FliJ [Armatimonadota bacterium]